MGIHEKLERSVERIFFGGRRTKASEYIAYATGNIVLMVILFFVALNTIGYDWTGQLYPPGAGYRLDFLTGGLEDGIPLVPEFVVFYVYLFYPLAVVTMAFFGLVEYRRGYALGWSLVAINAIALAVYVVFPVSTYWWRQEFLAHPMPGFWAEQATPYGAETHPSTASRRSMLRCPRPAPTHGTGTGGLSLDGQREWLRPSPSSSQRASFCPPSS